MRAIQSGIGLVIAYILKSDAYHFIHEANKSNLQNKALILREKLLKRLADNGVRGETFHVISAITLGARDNLDPETTESFTRTGTLHVLAVSGGNVAVIFLLLNFLLYFLKKYRTGVILHALIIIIRDMGICIDYGIISICSACCNDVYLYCNWE